MSSDKKNVRFIFKNLRKNKCDPCFWIYVLYVFIVGQFTSVFLKIFIRCNGERL